VPGYRFADHVDRRLSLWRRSRLLSRIGVTGEEAVLWAVTAHRTRVVDTVKSAEKVVGSCSGEEGSAHG